MAGIPLRASQFKNMVEPAINQVFDEQYKIMELENFKKWVEEAYPQVFKEYYYVKAVGE